MLSSVEWGDKKWQELWVGMNLKDGSHDLFQANIRKFAWRDKKKQRFEPSTHQIQFYKVTVISSYLVVSGKDD